MVIDLKEYLETRIADEGLPVLIIFVLELGQVLGDEEELHAEPRCLRDGVFDDLHPLQAGEFVEQEQRRESGLRTPLDALHLAEGQCHHQPQPAKMRIHVALRQGEINCQTAWRGFDRRQIEVRLF